MDFIVFIFILCFPLFDCIKTRQLPYSSQITKQTYIDHIHYNNIYDFQNESSHPLVDA